MGKRLLLLLTALFGTLFIDCTNDNGSGSCDDFVGEYFDITGIESIVHYGWTSSYAAPALSDNASIDFDEFHSTDLFFSKKHISEEASVQRARNTTGRLYALSCIGNGYMGSKEEKYQAIYITTMHDFNDQYAKGDTINSLLEIRSLYSDEYFGVEEFLQVSDTYIPYPSLNLLLTESPTHSDNYQFKISIELSTGEVYSALSPTVRFK